MHKNKKQICVNIKPDHKFIESIINGMYDWVRVIDRDDNLLYINRAMSESVASSEVGKKCYEALGRNNPCENCISRSTVFDGHTHHKEEVIGNRIYSVMSSPLRDESGEITAVIEVLRDITLMKDLQKQIMLQNKKLQDNLNLARKLQCCLLPKALPEDKIDFAFVYKPCEDLGGDFLDTYMIDKDHLGIYIADVSGHGVPASMLTVFLRSTINKKTHSPSQALFELFQQFNSSNFDNNFYITVFYAVINLESMEMVYSNAGHNVAPIIIRNNEFKLLRTPGIPISNWLEEPCYHDMNINLLTGDKVFFYTDGIVEIKNSSNEQYGEERLTNILLNDTSEPDSILNRIVESACAFAGINSVALPDDITLGMLHVK